MEEVAEQYLMELVGRNLVQVSSFNIKGKVTSCRVHDLIREMILKKCEDLSFCRYISREDDSMLSGIVRRQSIGNTESGIVQRQIIASIESTESSHVRSLLLFGDDSTEDYLMRLFKEYRLLKMLDFGGAGRFFHFPENLGNLIHLKYLSFRGIVVEEITLPKSIGKLQNLETLIVWRTSIRIMPKEICKLRKLRYLGFYRMSLIGVKDGIGGMISLQTLKYVAISDDGDGVKVIRELGKLRQLRNLGLEIQITKDDGSGLCSLLNEMQHLELEKQHIIAGSTNEQVLNQNLVSSPPKFLLKIWLKGWLNKLPEGIQELRNLVKLTLYNTYLTEDPLKSLQNLPNLLRLNLDSCAYSGESLHLEEGGFQNLLKLYLAELRNLNSIIIDKGTMSSLKELTFRSLLYMERVPTGIHYLDKLQSFTLFYMPKKFTKRIGVDGGEDQWIINHVPCVNIH